MSSVFSKILALRFSTYFKLNYVFCFLQVLNLEVFALLQNKPCFQFSPRSYLWNFWLSWRSIMFQVFSNVLTLKFLNRFKINYAICFFQDVNSEIFDLINKNYVFSFLQDPNTEIIDLLWNKLYFQISPKS